ncbi:response regulator [Telluribacter sp. SYSU D00476]|uniref:response regulator n=1 Tax=Telluribacter sp. SYSU D00476 TaxID=2811430 RepID=UPI001FF29475|nr:response regulator [Telluribacter sp. SYSU D00476]
MATSQEYGYLPVNFHQARLLLIAADDGQAWTGIKAALRQSLPEVELVIAEDLPQAYVLLAEWQSNRKALPKLILLDFFQRRDLQRKQWLQELKEDEAPYRNIPVVVLSDSADQADVREAYGLGCSAYMVRSGGAGCWLQIFHAVRRYWWDTVLLPLS